MMISLFKRQVIKTADEQTPGQKSDHDSHNSSDAPEGEDDNKSQKSEKFVAKSGSNKDLLVNEM